MIRKQVIGRATIFAVLLTGIQGCSSDDNPVTPKPDVGTVVINPEPNIINATWQVSGPSGFSQSGSGDLTLGNMVVGSYSVTWGAVVGYTIPSPNPVTITLAPDGQITFVGDYTPVGGPIEGFVLIPAGTFTMGSPSGEPGRIDNEVQHQVTLTRSFWMATTEVTEEFWDSVMGSGISTSQFPKVDVDWYEAVAFCNALSLQDGLTPAYSGSGTSWTWNQSADGYRLPTEAEWEYACRSGSTTAFANGGITATDCGHDPNLDALGWYCGNSGDLRHAVGQKAANAWGLYDMHGNVWEWCWDWYEIYPAWAVTDPVGPEAGSRRLLRGGDFHDGARVCRSALRSYRNPADGYYGPYGFRLTRTAF